MIHLYNNVCCFFLSMTTKFPSHINLGTLYYLHSILLKIIKIKIKCLFFYRKISLRFLLVNCIYSLNQQTD